MHDTWGLTGPQFIGIYLLLFFITLAVAIRLRLSARKLGGAHPVTPDLTADEAAYLSGGARRLVDVSLARLVASGALRVSRGHRPQATGKAAESTMDGQVLTAVQDRKPAEGADTATKRLRASAELAMITDRLRHNGLLVTPDRERTARWRAMIAFAPILLLGALRLSDGVSNGKPVTYLIILLALTGFALLMIAVVPGPRATTLGQRALRKAQSGLPDRRTIAAADADPLMAAGVLYLVALHGMSGHPDSAIASGLATGSGGSASGGGGCSGGGGGGCGGGGGGCGG